MTKLQGQINFFAPKRFFSEQGLARVIGGLISSQREEDFFYTVS